MPIVICALGISQMHIRLIAGAANSNILFVGHCV